MVFKSFTTEANMTCCILETSEIISSFHAQNILYVDFMENKLKRS